ncbi:MAG: hypothetical protein ACXV97_02915 [Chthoniobacterales bacterium]
MPREARLVTLRDMMRRSCAVFCVFILALSCNAAAQSVNDAWKKLDDAMKREIDTPPKDENGRSGERMDGRKRMVVAQLRTAIEGSAHNEPLENILSQVAEVFRSDDVMRETENLRTALKKEREAKDAAFLARINDVTKHAAEAFRTAKEPRDLDNLLKEFAELAQGQREDHMSDATRAAFNKLPATKQFILRWQDYLAAAKSGDPRRANDMLRNLANSAGDNVDFIPRSEILALIERHGGKDEPNTAMPVQGELEQIAAKAKTLADVAGVLKELHALVSRRQQSQSFSGMDQAHNTINALTPIENAYRNFQAGLPTSLEAGLNQSDQGVVNLTPLRVELVFLMLPRYLGLSPDTKPKAGESVDAFIDRVAALARERGDIALLKRTHDAKRALSRGSHVWNESGLMAFVSGQNQEAAGQYMLAVISYQNALRSGGDDISPKLIGQKLDAIKAAHPEDYEKGMARFFNPHSSRDSMSEPNSQENRPPRVLVPAATPTSTAAPSPSARP